MRIHPGVGDPEEGEQQVLPLQLLGWKGGMHAAVGTGGAFGPACSRNSKQRPQCIMSEGNRAAIRWHSSIIPGGDRAEAFHGWEHEEQRRRRGDRQGEGQPSARPRPRRDARGEAHAFDLSIPNSPSSRDTHPTSPTFTPSPASQGEHHGQAGVGAAPAVLAEAGAPPVQSAKG